MPMEVLYAQPYLEDLPNPPTPSDFPQAVDVLIGGHPYVVNTSFEPYRRDAFRHRSIQAQRESIDLTNIAGEGTVNTEGLWRRGADDWHFGAGQPYQDRKGSVDGRFSTSKGINPWMEWQCELLNETQQLLSTTANAQVIQVGEYLYVMDFTSNVIEFTTNFIDYSEVGGLSGTLFDAATDGYNLWITSSTAVFATTAGSTSSSTYVTSGFQGIWYVADRLMTTSGPNIYNIVTSGSAPAPLWTHPNSAFHWADMAAGSGNIYYAGFSNLVYPVISSIYQNTIEATGTALTIPVQALPLEGGEYAAALYGYLNYIFVGTNLGVRMCRTLSQYDPTGNQGDLEAGPLIPGLFPPGPVSQAVQCFTANNRFLYFGWSNYDGESTGIGRLDLSTFIDTQAPAFTSDLMVTGQGLVTGMTWCDLNSAPVFVIVDDTENNISGVYTESNVPVAEGTITSGYLGYGISDDKILWAGDIGTLTPQEGSVSMSLSADGAALTFAGSSVNGGAPVQSPFPIPQIRGELFTVQMTLFRDSQSLESPLLHRWTLKALPAITAGTTISAVLLLYATVSNRGGDLYFNAYQEYQYLYNLRTSQTVVTYQEGPFSAKCVIDELDWLPFKESDSDPQGGFIGDLIVYLKTVDLGA